MMDDQSQTAGTPASAGNTQTGDTDKYGRQLFKAVCAKCGGEALVPFQPTDGRPVYCQNCYQPRPRRDFGGSRGGHSGKGFGGRNQ